MRPSPWWLLLFAFIAYGGSLFGDFVLDDFAIFVDPVLTSGTGWWEVWRFEQTRPLTYFTFWLNHQASGRDPLTYHAINLALHAAAVLIAFSALKRFNPPEVAFWAAAIFAVHPMQSEAVNYIFARSTLLMTLFCLLSLRDWVAGARYLAVLWFALALLAKEEAVGFVLLLVLLKAARTLGDWKSIAAMALLAIASGLRVLFATAAPGSGAGFQAGISVWEYFARQPAAIMTYAVHLVWPVYTIDPPVPPALWWLWIVLIAAAAVAARRPSGIWLVGALTLLAPTSTFLPIADVMAYRRMYFPLLLVGLLAAIYLPRRAVPLLVAAFATISIYRCYVWASPARLWREALAANPDAVRPTVQLARLVDTSDAANLLERARLQHPDSPLIASELGRIYLTSGSPEKALSEFGRGLALTPNDPQALSNRAVALLLLKQNDAAQADLERALQLDSCAFEPRLNAIRMGLRPAAASGCRYTPDQQRALQGQ